MLNQTFCHIPGIGPKSEQKLWDQGYTSWASITDESLGKMSPKRRATIQAYIDESEEMLALDDGYYFGELLPNNQTWRMFPHFAHSAAYLDIETTGLDSDIDYITTIAVCDGKDSYTFVRGENLSEFGDLIADFELLVTYNGKTFDLPFLRKQLRTPLEHAHIDLRYVLASLGETGGLKACEKRLGLDREDLADIDGYFAVLLWRDYERNGNAKALETLLAYNVADVVNLAAIMPMAYNMKLKETPFHETNQIPLVDPPSIPFEADMETIQRLRPQAAYW